MRVSRLFAIGMAALATAQPRGVLGMHFTSFDERSEGSLKYPTCLGKVGDHDLDKRWVGRPRKSNSSLLPMYATNAFLYSWLKRRCVTVEPYTS
jgi:hypothetical protein